MSHVEEAKRLLRAGVSVIPIPQPFRNGSKACEFPWRRYTETEMSTKEAETHFATAWGFAIVCGNVSGSWTEDEEGELQLCGLTVLDFDLGPENVYSKFALEVEQQLPGLISTLPTEKTLSGGIHVFFRAPGCQGNQKLARRENETLIETRGEHGIIYCAPTPGYQILWGDFAAIPCLTSAQSGTLFDIARSFGEPTRELEYRPTKRFAGARQSDEFNANADWIELLRDAGAKVRQRKDGRLVVTRPGKSEGVSATTGWGHDGVDRMYVFTSNWPGLEPERCYTKFAFIALTKFGGDFRRAATEMFPRVAKKKILTYTYEAAN